MTDPENMVQIQRFIQPAVLLPRLQQAGVLVVYDPELHKGINRLLERGLIKRERQTYTLTEEGQQELAAAAQATAFAGSPTRRRAHCG